MEQLQADYIDITFKILLYYFSILGFQLFKFVNSIVVIVERTNFIGKK